MAVTPWKQVCYGVYKCLGASALLMMANNATFPSVCAGESQAGNPISSALVLIKYWYTCSSCYCDKFTGIRDFLIYLSHV